ncbi:hypothetical protein AB0B15_10550 [Streptomyces sp. NPDC045456]|uniref:hypothetical protein n=1 Tax=Streptomyces sp. NPDC045456 TaxID=3155254 RepID=UPI0033C0A0DD
MRIFTRLSAVMRRRKKPTPQKNSTPIDPVRLAAYHLAEVLDSLCCREAGGHFQCDEADAIACVLAEAGRVREAESWLAGHAEADIYGDAHYQGTERPEGDTDMLPVAVDIREYVAALVA